MYFWKPIKDIKCVSCRYLHAFPWNPQKFCELKSHSGPTKAPRSWTSGRGKGRFLTTLHGAHMTSRYACKQHFQIWRYSKGLISVLCSCPCASLRLNGRWLETAPWLRETESVDIIHQAAAAGRTLMQGWSAGGLIRPHPAQVWPREWRVQPEAENIHQRRHVKGKDSIAPSSCGQMNHNYCGNCLFYFRMREIDTREDTFVIKRNNECLFSRFILITSLKQSWWGWVLWLFDEMTSMSVTLM